MNEHSSFLDIFLDESTDLFEVVVDFFDLGVSDGYVKILEMFRMGHCELLPGHYDSFDS